DAGLGRVVDAARQVAVGTDPHGGGEEAGEQASHGASFRREQVSAQRTLRVPHLLILLPSGRPTSLDGCSSPSTPRPPRSPPPSSTTAASWPRRSRPTTGATPSCWRRRSSASWRRP